jgi:protein-disulfide isomerase
MDRRYFIAAGALAIAGGAGFWLTRPGLPGATGLVGEAAAQGTEAATEADFARVPDMIKGDPDAPITVIEYASFTCPHCASFHLNVMPRLQSAYIDTGKVRFINREVYFDRYGLWAAMLARCGDEARYFPMIDMIYQEQRDWAGSNDPAAVADNLRRLGRRSGLTTDEVDACLQDADMARAMVAVYQHHAAQDQVQATPSFVIDGERHSNMSFEAFAEILDAKLGE